jgi:hypothetical protein
MMRSPLSDSSLGDFLQPSVFYAGEDNKLSGVGVFSPASSHPPSPVLSRLHLPQDESSIYGKEQLRHRVTAVEGELKSTLSENQ